MNGMEAKEELIKCSKDFFYFAENHILSHLPDLEILDSKTPTFCEFHRKLFESYETNQFVIVKKFRQGGFTTFNLIYALWKCLFEPDQNILFICGSDRSACLCSNLFDKIIQSLPGYLKPKLKINNHHKKCFEETNSSICFHSPEAMCSKAATYLFIEEAAFINNMDDYWLSACQVVLPDGKCFVSSTPNKVGDWFQQTWQSAKNQQNQFIAFDTHYKDHPRYKNQQLVTQLKHNLGEKLFKQEFECKFYNPKEDKFMEDLCFENDCCKKSYEHCKKEEMTCIEKWEKTGILKGLNGDKKRAAAVLLENQRLFGESLVDPSENQFKRISIALVRKIASTMKSYDLVSVQVPLGPASLAYFKKDNKIISLDVKSNENKLKCVWSYDSINDLRSHCNLDAEAELTEAIAQQIALEYDRKVVYDIYNHAAIKKTINYQGLSSCHLINQAIDLIDELKQLYDKPYCNWMVCSPEIVDMFGIEKDTDCDAGFALAIKEVGVWNISPNRSLKVFVDPLMPKGSMVFGYKGETNYDSGYLLSTYIPLKKVKKVLNDSFINVDGLSTFSCNKMIDPTFYAVLNVI